MVPTLQHSFQSRNRDAFDFNNIWIHCFRKKTIQFQSRNRDAFDFNQQTRHVSAPSVLGFNLVIEMLLISTTAGNTCVSRIKSFQSRNRDAFDFNLDCLQDFLLNLYWVLFQSRNRDAFDFNPIRARIGVPTTIMFQSRNRDAFDFNTWDTPNGNGGIVVFQSRNRDAFDFNFYQVSRYERGLDEICFNLVIEMLLISTFVPEPPAQSITWFQSRNRDAFDFNFRP